MRAILVIVLSLTLGACAGQSIFAPITTSIPNPVTPNMLYDVENGLTVAVTGMIAYKRLCVAKAIDQSCRGVVQTLQGYTRRAKPILVSLRGFVRNNDQVNAITAYQTIQQLLAAFQSTAALNGVK